MIVLSTPGYMKNLNFLSEIKAITLDWGDTLIHVVGKDQKIYDFRRLYYILKELFPHIKEEIINTKSKRIIDEITLEYDKKFNNAKCNWQDCNKSELLRPALEKEFPQEIIPWEKLFDKFCFQDSRIAPFYKDLDLIFNLFKELNWKIGLLSHVTYEEKFVRKNFESQGLLPYFDFFSLSGDLKLVKPHPLHFQDAAKKSGFKPHQILHIGDHPEKDGLGAKNAGFRVALIVEPGHYGLKEVAATPADLYITSIFELPFVIKEWQNNPNSSFYSNYIS